MAAAKTITIEHPGWAKLFIAAIAFGVAWGCSKVVTEHVIDSDRPPIEFRCADGAQPDIFVDTEGQTHVRC